MNAVPLTKATEIIDRANAFARAGGPFASRDDLWWRSLKRQVDDVIKIDPGVGWSTYGTIMALVGDVEEMERGFRAALPFAGARPDIITNWLVNKSNLGYYSEALQLSIEYADPKTGYFTDRYPILVRAGGFSAASKFLVRAREMGIEIASLDPERIELAAQLLSRAELSDEDIARHLDIAGTLMREMGHLHVGNPIVDVQDVDGVFSGVTYVLNMRLGQEDVFELNCALADAEVEKGIKRHPYFDISFAAA
ncbi:MAG: hypothetical protein V4468_03650 [Pseudomonadota bacterium]